MSSEEEFARQVEKEREELRKKQAEYIESLKREREEEKKRKEKEEEFREKERIASERRQLEMLQQGWTTRHRAIYEEINNLGIDPRFVHNIDLTGERGIKYRMLLSEFLSLPIDLGTQQLTERKYYTVYALGIMFEIYRDENNKWKLRYDYKLLPHAVKLIVENDTPIALETYVNNPLFPEMPLKAIVKLKK